MRSWDPTKEEGGQSRRKDMAPEPKQRHKNKEPGTGLEKFDDPVREIRMVERRRQSESLD